MQVMAVMRSTFAQFLLIMSAWSFLNWLDIATVIHVLIIFYLDYCRAFSGNLPISGNCNWCKSAAGKLLVVDWCKILESYDMYTKMSLGYQLLTIPSLNAGVDLSSSKWLWACLFMRLLLLDITVWEALLNMPLLPETWPLSLQTRDFSCMAFSNCLSLSLNV